jgi:protoheme ferro-lyase
VLDALPAGATVDVVPMYAAESAFTHEISRRTVAAWNARRRGRAPVRVTPPLDPDVLAEISAEFVRHRLDAAGVRGGADCALVLAAHGTLLEPPRPMETGRVATEQVFAGIARRLSGEFGRIGIGWLNHVYGGRWTEPAADVALREIAAAGFRRVVYFPFGFLADNAESQLEGRVALRTQPQLEALHLPCLNASPALASALAAAVIGERAGVEESGRVAAVR